MSKEEREKPFANVQQQMLAARVEWEIHQMIFPHIKQQGDHQYPFVSIDEVMKEYYRHRMEATINLAAIGQAAARMQPEYNDAFCYIAFREISYVVKTFLELAEQRAKTHPRESEATVTSA